MIIGNKLLEQFYGKEKMRYRLMLLIVMTSICVTESKAGSLRPDQLRCEYLVNPQGIDIAKPRLSWKLKSEARGQRQAAYRILVATSLEKLAKDKGDLWDSGKVKSYQSTQVAYGGMPLPSRTSCFWKVKTWNSTWNSDKKDSSWSSPARWSMGLLKPEDWSAKWISMKQELDQSPAEDLTSRNSPMLRKSFTISKPVKEAQVSICGLGYYEMFLNGSKVGDHVLDPTWTSYHKNALYVTYDISETLKKGANALGVQLANGVYNQEFGDAWNFQKAPWRAFPQMLLQLDIVYTDGTKKRIVSEESWKVSTGPIYWDQLRMGVMYDARREHPGWSTAKFNDSGWKPAVIREGIKGKLTAQMSEPTKVMKTLKSVNITKKNDSYEFDFGQNIAGWSRLKVSGKAGTKITMDHGWHSLVYGKPLQTDVYTLSGKGEEVWEPGFTYHGFSKVKVSGLPKAPDKETLEARVVYTAFDERGAFECSKPLLNKIVEMARWSYVGNFVGIPTDCPHREKNGWSADAHISAELGLNYYGSEAAYTRWMLNFESIQAEDGKLPCIVPDGGDDWGTRFLDGPAWESAYLIIPWHIYEYRGDRRILEHHYENYKRWLGWYRDKDKVIEKKRFEHESSGSKESKYKNPQKVNQNNIIYYGIGDWPPNGKTPFEITSTAYYYNAAKIISKTAHLLGKRDEEKEYADLATKIKAAFNREFYDETTGTYSKGSHTGMSCALYFGLVEEKNRQRVADNLADGLRNNGYNIEIGCLGSKFLLRALADNGHLDVAYEIITNESRPGWGFLADSGRTTFPERMDGGGSDNHVFLGDIAAWMMQYLAGIRLDQANPGFQHFIIKPELPGDMEWVKAHHDSPYGRIRSEWEKEGSDFSLKITVPANSVAEVYIPASKADTVKESGKPAKSAEGVKFLRMDNNRAVFEVGSGDYNFEVR
jgi:alpha-L-rhamnosidase